MKCKICESNLSKVFTGRLLNKYDVSFYSCPGCFNLSTEKAYWLPEAYQNPINESDLGLLGRNVFLSKIVSILCFFNSKKNTYLDYAGGYGVFTRLMRDVGFDFYWNDEYTTNLFSKGFGLKENTFTQKFDLLTSFETLEHFEDPCAEFKEMLELSDNILISTLLFKSNEIPKFPDWWYYGAEHGQHISFFTVETLTALAAKFDLCLYTNKVDLHYFTKSKNNKLKLNLLFFFFGNQAWKRLLRELVFIIVKFRMPSKTFSDLIHIQSKNQSTRQP